MSRARRPIAAFMMLIFFQLVLGVGTYGCQMSESDMASDASMDGMPMPGNGEHSLPAPDQPGHHESPCQLPSSVNGCQNTTPCALVAVTVTSASSGMPQVERLHAARLTLELLAPASISLAPELPPPRA